MVTDPNQKVPQNKDSGFYTMKEYQQAGAEGLTSSMEDYLEMLCRLQREGSTCWQRAFMSDPPPLPRCWEI